MDWLRFQGLERHYGARRIFGAASGVLRDGAKIGLVGRNGTGKSSLLRLLAGVDELEGGTIARARNARLGYLGQEAVSDPALTLHALIDSAFSAVRAEALRLRELEERLAAAGDAASPELLERYARAHEAYDHHGGAATERRIRSLIAALGFSATDLERPTAEFSGGQRTRAMLARVLLEQPDYLLLDEPTNHLDGETVRWLEEFIAADTRAFIIVSHDRYFLDRAATEIWELEREQLFCYQPVPKAAYSAYLGQRAARIEEERRKFAAWQAEARAGREVIAELRTHGSHNYAQVRSREKRLAKLAPVEAPAPETASIGVSLDPSRRLGSGFAFEVSGLAKAFAQPVLQGVTFAIARGDRVAIVGPNGSGKSTLLAMLADRLAPDAGTIRTGQGLTVAYFSQASADDLGQRATAVEAVSAAAGGAPEEFARGLLGRMGLGGDEADKTVDRFSGGERRRIMLARLMAQRADCLLLDEPTNDLDIASSEALEEVLRSYGGTVVLVSHDRYLLKAVCTRIIMLREGGATVIDDGYDRYEAVRAGTAASSAPERPREAGRNERQAAKMAAGRLRREVEYWEAQVVEFDRRRGEIEHLFTDPDLYADQARTRELQAELELVKGRSASALTRWEAALHALESSA